MADNNILELSCLHLMTYLASWGMLRGASFLFDKSIYYYKDLIINISKLDKSYFEIDVDNYNKTDSGTGLDRREA